MCRKQRKLPWHLSPMLLSSVSHYSDLYLFYRLWMLVENYFIESQKHAQFYSQFFSSFTIKQFKVRPEGEYQDKAEDDIVMALGSIQFCC